VYTKVQMSLEHNINQLRSSTKFQIRMRLLKMVRGGKAHQSSVQIIPEFTKGVFGWMYKEGWNEVTMFSIVFGWESTGGEVNNGVIFGDGVIPKNRRDGGAPDSSYFDFKPNTP
jgi:hypothetical protein